MNPWNPGFTASVTSTAQLSSHNGDTSKPAAFTLNGAACT